MEGVRAPAESTETQGFLRDVAQSIKSHIDDRLRSPFAGAFVVAWMAVNWKAILILLLSSSSLDDRIGRVSVDLGQYEVLWHPLWLAVCLALLYYLFSAIFLIIVELYGVIKRYLERLFDNVHWASPTEYMGLKRRYRDRERELTDLATDNLEQLTNEKNKATQFLEDKLRLQAELSERATEIQSSINSLSASEERNRELSETLSSAQARSHLVEIKHDAIANAARELGYAFGEMVENRIVFPERIDEALASMPPWETSAEPTAIIGQIAQFIRDISIQHKGELSQALFGQPVTESSIEEYSRARYPTLPLAFDLQQKLMSDFVLAGLGTRIHSIRDLDRLLRRASDALRAYSAARPDLFNSGTDYITKGLGFTVPEFRRIHGFSNDTMDAFVKYSHMVRAQ